MAQPTQERPDYKRELNAFLFDYFTASGHNQSAIYSSLTQAANTADDMLHRERSGARLTDKQEKYLENIAMRVRAHIRAGREFSQNRDELIELYCNTGRLLSEYPDRKDRKLTTLQGYHTQRLNDIKRPDKIIYSVYLEGLIVALKELEKRGVAVGILMQRATELSEVFWEGYMKIREDMGNKTANGINRISNLTQNPNPAVSPIQ